MKFQFRYIRIWKTKQKCVCVSISVYPAVGLWVVCIAGNMRESEKWFIVFYSATVDGNASLDKYLSKRKCLHFHFPLLEKNRGHQKLD